MIDGRSSARWYALGLGLFCGLSAAAAAPPSAPSPEQLLAATIHAGDLGQVGPGGWWDDVPEFNDRREPDGGAELRNAVMSHVFGKPDDAPAEVATSVRFYDKAAAAADAFDASAETDKRDYGATEEGPKVGEQSRYLRQKADSEHEGGVALRLRFGRYLVRIDIGGAAATMTDDRVAALGKLVIVRLAQLDAGTLAAPALPEIAKALPAADAEFQPVLGTAAIARDSWNWIWSSQNSALVVSPRLRAIVGADGRGEASVMRRYGLRVDGNDIAEIAVLPFRNADAARRYLGETKHEDARRAAIANREDDVVVSPPIPDVSPAYRADFRGGRYVAEVTCFAPFAPTSAACAAAVRELAARVKKALPAK